MKLTGPFAFVMLFAACALTAPVVRAGTTCPDDPERCVERGATVSRTAGVVTGPARAVALPAVVTATVAKAPAAATRKQVKPVRVAPAPAAPAPATPGMGMLLKLSIGNGGDVSWFPGRTTENSGGSWIL